MSSEVFLFCGCFFLADSHPFLTPRLVFRSLGRLYRRGLRPYFSKLKHPRHFSFGFQNFRRYQLPKAAYVVTFRRPSKDGKDSGMRNAYY